MKIAVIAPFRRKLRSYSMQSKHGGTKKESDETDQRGKTMQVIKNNKYCAQQSNDASLLVVTEEPTAIIILKASSSCTLCTIRVVERLLSTIIMPLSVASYEVLRDESR